MTRHTRTVVYNQTLTGKDLADFAKDVPLDAEVQLTEETSRDSYSLQGRDRKRVRVTATWEGRAK